MIERTINDLLEFKGDNKALLNITGDTEKLLEKVLIGSKAMGELAYASGSNENACMHWDDVRLDDLSEEDQASFLEKFQRAKATLKAFPENLVSYCELYPEYKQKEDAETVLDIFKVKDLDQKFLNLRGIIFTRPQ